MAAVAVIQFARNLRAKAETVAMPKLIRELGEMAVREIKKSLAATAARVAMRRLKKALAAPVRPQREMTAL